MRTNPRYAAGITASWLLPAQSARLADLPVGICDATRAALARCGVQSLYSHQSQAIASILRGQDVAIVTGPASGKTLCYNIPVLDVMLQNPTACALYLFPTKALAQDQLTSWLELSRGVIPNALAATYDGDTPAGARARIRREARLLITNPDMLHVGILPHHARWQRFFAGLDFVVVDEMHSYRGLFGSHVANVLRRLQRICTFHGSRPIFVSSSATIANPGELARHLLGRDVTVIAEDGAPRGDRHFVLYRPPAVGDGGNVQRSLVLEAASVANLMLDHGLATIVFGRSRLTTELMLTYLREHARQRRRTIQSIRGYRGGYLPRERRAIEAGLRTGKVQGVAATNALELGVDIGELTACVLAGFPGTIASTRQQAGRAGRRQESSVTVLVGGATALDQYILMHPEYLSGRTPERAWLAPDNVNILRSHLKCACFELPIGMEAPFDSQCGVEDHLMSIAAEEGVLRRSGGKWYWMSSQYPAQGLSLRTASARRVSIRDEGRREIGEVDGESAAFLVYPGAVYLHEGETYLVRELDQEEGRATAARSEVDYFTDVSVSVNVDVQEVWRSSELGDLRREAGLVRVVSRPTRFRQVQFYTHAVIGEQELDLPERELVTEAYWLALRDTMVRELRDAGDWTIAPILSYGPNWSQQRRRARRKDGFCCRNCGKPEPVGRQHDVHHLRPFRSFDCRPGENSNYLLANRLSNLVTLCPDCHPRVEALHAVQGTLEGLAHLMASLAPIYLMCDRRDFALISDLEFRHTGTPAVMAYDLVPGGAGLSRALYQLDGELLHSCWEWLDACSCADGCPACTGAPPQPGAGAKHRVRQLLARLLECLDIGRSGSGTVDQL